MDRRQIAGQGFLMKTMSSVGSRSRNSLACEILTSNLVPPMDMNVVCDPLTPIFTSRGAAATPVPPEPVGLGRGVPSLKLSV